MGKIIQGDALTVLKTLDSESVNCCVTSPPYWALRDYSACSCSVKRNYSEAMRTYGGANRTDGVGGTISPTDPRCKKEPDPDCPSCKGTGKNLEIEKSQLGLESTFQEYITKLCDIFDEVKRVLRKDGTCWVNLGDTYGGSGNSTGHTEETKNLGYTTSKMGASKGNQDTTKGYEKCLLQIPSRFSIEMCNCGWILRNTIIWYKPNCMPSSVKDRFTVDFEYIFFFVKNKKYWFEQQKEKTLTKDNSNRNRDITKLNNTPGRSKMKGLKVNNYDFKNKRCVWKITTKPFKEAHFAVFPEELVETPLKAGCPKRGVVIDPFCGSGTTGVVAKKQGKEFIGIELNKDYIAMAEKRIANTQGSLL